MKAMMKTVTVGLLMAAAVIGAADTGHARPKRPTYTTKCTCTCVAFDENSVRVEGDSFTFDTSGQDCRIGITIGCGVESSGEILWGAYASCMGITREEKSRGIKAGLLDPRPAPPPSPPSSRLPGAVAPALPQLAPATATRR